MLAKRSGQDQPGGTADGVKHRGQPLRRRLHLPGKQIPHYTTYRRRLPQVVRPTGRDRLVGAGRQRLPGMGYSDLIAIAGTTVRVVVSPQRPRGEHLLAAYLPEVGVVLMQVAAGDKENGITVAPHAAGVTPPSP